MGIGQVGSRKLGIGKSGIRQLAALLAAILAILVLATIAQAQDAATSSGSGVIEGRVVNGTAGGPEVGAGITVTLHTLEGETEGPSLQTVTDAAGTFRFEGLDTNPDIEYWPDATYLGVLYNDDTPYQFTAGQTTLAAVLTVYETTEDDSAITLDSAHFIMESFGQVLRISEIHLYGNSGDRTYVGHTDGKGQRTTLFIPLPANAVGVAFDQDTPTDRFIEVDGGMLDTEPVPPGQETALAYFSYHLVVTGSSMPLERSFAYPVTMLNILAAQPGLAVRSDQLQDMGPQAFQNVTYDMLALQGLALNTPLVMELLPSADTSGSTSMPSAPGASDMAAANTVVPGSTQGLLRWFGFALALIAVAGVLVYASAARRPAAARAVAPNLATNAASRRLLAELVDLEDAYAADRDSHKTGDTCTGVDQSLWPPGSLAGRGPGGSRG
jgi:hypothetical protein